MGVYNNNKDGTRSTIANTIQVVNAPMEQFVSRGEFSAVVPSDTSADNKLVAENEVTKVVDTMPNASADLVGTTVQYVGTTTTNYTNGYFYKCVRNDGTYSWVYISTYDDTEIKQDIADTNQNIRSGRTDYDYALELGFYNASGVWAASSKHASVHEMLSFPSGVTLRASTTLSGVTPSIKEYSASGTRLRVVQGNPIVLTDIVEGNKYNFDFFRSNDYTELPSTGYFIQSIPDYFASMDTSIERINSSLDNLKQESAYSYTASTQTLELINHDTKYILKRVVNTAVNLDSWRLYAGYIKINGTWSNMWENSDAEGPIKIDNERDFISGFHGDEVLQDIAIYIDNALLDTSVDSSGVFNSLVMYQTSTVYRTDSQEAAFTRYKKVSFQGDNYSVHQRWVALVSCKITESALALLQCYKTKIVGWDTDTLIPLQSKDSGDVELDKGTRRGNIILNDGKMVTIVAEKGGNDFEADLVDYTDQNRIKFYFRMFKGESLNVGDVLNSKFSVLLNNYV